MSRFWREPIRETKVGQLTDDRHAKRHNTMAPLLRLDSTGEVTSDNKGHMTCPNSSYINNESRRCCRSGLRKLVDGLNMNSVIDTANSYLGSAGVYFGGLCPYKTGKSLIRTESSEIEKAATKYMQGLIESDESIMKPQNHINTVHKPSPNSNSNSKSQNTCVHMNDTVRSSSSQSANCNWSESILDAIQSTILNNTNNMPCPLKSESMKSPRTEPYRPPHLRTLSCGVHKVDPKLTPYNARLLQMSKRSQSQSIQNGKVDGYRRELFSEKTNNENILNGDTENKSNLMRELPSDYSGLTKNKDIADKTENNICTGDVPKDTCNALDKEHDTSKQTNVITAGSGKKEKQSDNIPDWFEYESDNLNTVPISLDPKTMMGKDFALQHKHDSVIHATEKYQTSQEAPVTNSNLHSWFSMENDVEDKKNNGNSKQVHQKKDSNESESCDKAKSIDHIKVPTEVLVDNEKIHDTVKNCDKTVSCKDMISDEKHHLVSVLYLRNCQGSKKSRPSIKKRRRQKVQQKEKMNDNSQGDQCLSNANKQSENVKRQNSSLSFILGNGASRSFLMSCDIPVDSESDWSDSDADGDSDSALEEDFPYGDQELGGLGLFSPLMNFKVTCSIQPTATTSSQSSVNSAINLSWQVNISVDSDSSKKKKTSTKKVHFPDDNDLTTIHPMITWSYAYQAARKGQWEEYARDRGRFLRRITESKTLLMPILDLQHRDRIYTERFSTLSE